MVTTRNREPVKVLTIAGSDSGGAAGLQADLKTFTALGAYGMSVITAVTAQNSLRVEGVHAVPVDFIAQQMDAVLSDYGAAAVKTGFIGQADSVKIIAERLASYKASAHSSCQIVIDPVLVNHKGESMFAPVVAQAYVDHLLPLADLITPNVAEARLLCDRQITSLATMEAAGRALHALGPRWILIKGDRAGANMVDMLHDGQEATLLRAPYIATENTHGSGDTLSAAVCVYLAQGLKMKTAVKQAHQFTHAAIWRAVNWRLGGGHGPLSHW